MALIGLSAVVVLEEEDSTNFCILLARASAFLLFLLYFILPVISHIAQQLKMRDKQFRLSSQPLLTHGADDLLHGHDHLHDGVPVTTPGPALSLLQRAGQVHLAKLMAGGGRHCLVREHDRDVHGVQGVGCLYLACHHKAPGLDEESALAGSAEEWKTTRQARG